VIEQGLKELFDLDLKNLRVLAVLLNKFDPKTDGAARDWLGIYEESAKLLYKEIDYKNEGRNAERFAENFKTQPWIKVRLRAPRTRYEPGGIRFIVSLLQVPKIYWEFTSERILGMEYVPGIKVSDISAIDAAGIDRKLLAKRSAESYLTQLCR
jgi:predicted unusual protein kinase regulating ubiquinone biosynthesis (AarF/ABC1/UbiB family)